MTEKPTQSAPLIEAYVETPSSSSSGSDADRLFAAGLLLKGHLDEERLEKALVRRAERPGTPLAQLLVELNAVTTGERQEFEDRLAARLCRETGDTNEVLRRSADRRAAEAAATLRNRNVRQFLIGDAAARDDDRGERVEARAGYRLIRIHDRGGLGEIWLGRDETLNREVAVKRIRADLDRREALNQRFVREAQITGQLQHPNIVRVYHVGVDAHDGRHFYAMELIKGRDFRKVVEERHSAAEQGSPPDPLAFDRLLGAFLKIVDAVDYAHARGVIHRDLKPANVMVGKFGEVVVLDWGLAKTVDADNFEDSEDKAATLVEVPDLDAAEMTRVGSVVGSPLFMAPEQAVGDVKAISERTDVYGLGAILFFVLTGRPPRSPAPGESMSDILARVASDPSPRARSLRPTVPKPLDAVCAKAMANDPDERYPSARELAEDVRRWRSDEPVRAFPESPLQRLARRMRKRPVVTLGVLAALLTLMIVASVLTTVFLVGVRQLESLQVEKLALDAKDMGEDLVGRLSDLKNDTVFFSQLPAVYRAINASDDRRTAAELSAGLFEPYLASSRYSRAIRLYEPPAAPKPFLDAVSPAFALTASPPPPVAAEADPTQPWLRLFTHSRKGVAARCSEPVAPDPDAGAVARVVVSFDLDQLWRKEIAINLETSVVSYLANESGMILFRSGDGTAEVGTDIRTTFPMTAPLFSDAEQRISTTRIGSNNRIVAGQRFHYDPAAGARFLVVCLTAPNETHQATERRLLVFALAAAAVTTAGALAVALGIVRLSARPRFGAPGSW